MKEILLGLWAVGVSVIFATGEIFFPGQGLLTAMIGFAAGVWWFTFGVMRWLDMRK